MTGNVNGNQKTNTKQYTKHQHQQHKYSIQSKPSTQSKQSKQSIPLMHAIQSKQILQPKIEIPVEEIDVETRAMSDRIKSEFQLRFDNLEKDITHIDNRMGHIQQFCTNLDAQVQNLQALIQNDQNPGKKAQYYQVMNNCMELNASYETLYIRCMELKQKYRKEQDDLHTRISKFTEIEIPKAKVDHGEQALTPANLALMMQELTRSIHKNDSKADTLKASIQELEENNDYKM